jgi:hypothetical protein
MSMMANPRMLDPRTVGDIKMRRGCGCQTTGRGRGRWSICDYHEGFDAALEKYAPEDTDEP